MASLTYDNNISISSFLWQRGCNPWPWQSIVDIGSLNIKKSCCLLIKSSHTRTNIGKHLKQIFGMSFGIFLFLMLHLLPVFGESFAAFYCQQISKAMKKFYIFFILHHGDQPTLAIFTLFRSPKMLPVQRWWTSQSIPGMVTFSTVTTKSQRF